MNAPIGVGIIGLSTRRGWAARTHLPALATDPAFELVTGSAGSPESSTRAAERFALPQVSRDHIDLVRNPDVDLVVVSVKVPHHHELVSAAIQAGKSVLCEWPLGNGLDEAVELASEADAKGVRAFVGLQARSAPAVRYVRHLVHEGEIGEVLSTSVVASGESWGAEIDPDRVYTLDRTNGASMLTIPFGHATDGICSVLGQFTEVNATTATRRQKILNTMTGEQLPLTAEDQIAVTGHLESGAVASIHFRGGLSAGTNFLWEINGTAGDIVVTGDTGHLQYGLVNVAMSTNGGLPIRSEIPADFRSTEIDLSSKVNSVAEAYAQIAEDMRTGSTHAPTFHDAVRRHRMIAAVEHSASTGQRVSLAA